MMSSTTRSLGERFRKLIHALERLTKTDLSYIAKGGFWLSIDQLASGLAAFMLAIVFARYVPKDVYGNYRYLVSVFWILTAFSLTGIPTALAQTIARGQEGTFRKSIRTSILWGIPMAAIAAGMGVYYFIQGNETFGYGLLIIAALGPLLQPSALFGSYLAGKKEFRTFALTGALYAATPALALIIAIFFTTSTLALIAVYLIGNIAIGAALTAFVFIRYKPDRSESTDVGRLGAHFSAMNLLSTIAGQVDKLIVFHYLGAVDLAVYSFAVALPEQARGALGGISVLAMPKFVSRPFHEIRKNFWSRLWLFTLGLAVVAGVYALLAPYLFRTFFPAYMDAVRYSQVYALALIPIGSALPVALLQSHVAKRELYIFNVLSPVLQILVLVWLTSSYGLMGTIIARIIGRTWSFGLSGALVETYGRRLTRIS